MWLTNKVVEVSKRIVQIQEALANGDLMRNEADQLRAELEDLEQLNEIFNAYLKIAGQSYKLQVKIARLVAERDALVAQIPEIRAEAGRAGFVAGRMYGLIPEHKRVMRKIIDVSATIYAAKVREGGE